MIEGPPRGVRTLVDLVARGARTFGDREALVTADRRWTYRDLATETARVARGWIAAGLEPEERVGVLLPNRPEFFSSVFGIQAAGGTAVCLNTMAPEGELREHLAQSGVRRIVYTPHFLKHDYVERLEAASRGRADGRAFSLRIAVAPEGECPAGDVPYASFGASPSVLSVAAPPAGEDAADALARLDRSTRDGVAAIFFTSGSTSRPKAVVHAHRALVHQAYVLADAFGVEAEDRTWGALPMFFTGGFVAVALVTLASGACLVLEDHFEAGRALDRMEAEGVSFYAGWQQAAALCDHESFPRRRLRLRKGMYADTPVTGRLLAPDHTSIQGYGLSETGTLVCTGRWDDPPDLRRRGFGRPLPGVEVSVVDPETGRRSGPGEVGEVRLRCPSMMLGYLGVPREEHFDAAGAFRTGDLGWLDETGTLQFAGRLKDVIKTAGVNVAAADVETFLEGLPGVRSAYVVPVPDARRGESVAAFVVAAPGAEVDPLDLQQRCRTELASYKVPRHLFLLSSDEIPRTGTQKVDKPRLRAEAARLAGGPRDLLAGARPA